MKKLVIALSFLPVVAMAAPSSINISEFIKPVAPSAILDGPAASSWCDGILVPETYQVCDERPIYEDKEITECHYESLAAEDTYSFTTPGRYQCRGPVYLGNTRYDLTRTEWRTDKIKVGVEKYNCQTRTRWVCEY
ncbi:hypothetical protein [Pseudoalteromonas denitrificans]|uniref:Uncharacterized protein n=1 Tax=Pseudoalteromonas denitrificans DSM 6059 TaxID=1123010 RepID=A0A1I1SR73_9GAMM|nr:hypothetical protein [Pseudoalteromonas denitrificans]SFD48954.1 hypothetical protein SAMN02745724_04662 [Pseudoalteromonas denitrificans DSM 6059]